MKSVPVDWRQGVWTGIIAGMVWGLIAMVINAISGLFYFEDRIWYNILSFMVGGGIFGVAAGGIMVLTYDWLPFKKLWVKAVFVSTSMWLILRIGGVVLSFINTERYYNITAQTIQGFILAIILGSILGFFLNLQQKGNL
ncbi:MAG: hypothetical protein ACE5EA_04040 [Nitrospirota bacterium]